MAAARLALTPRRLAWHAVRYHALRASVINDINHFNIAAASAGHRAVAACAPAGGSAASAEAAALSSAWADDVALLSEDVSVDEIDAEITRRRAEIEAARRGETLGLALHAMDAHLVDHAVHLVVVQACAHPHGPS